MGIETLALTIALSVSAATGTFVSVAAVTLGLQVVGAAALSIGLSYAQQALARTQTDRAGVSFGDSPAAINAPEVRGNVKQATPSQRIVLGETRCGGAMALYEVKPPYLYLQIYYSSLPLTDFRTLYIGGEKKVAFAALPENTIVSPLAIADQPNYAGRLEVCVQRGSLDQGVNALIERDFSELGDRFMAPGLPNCVFKFDYGADADEFLELWGNVQIPDVTWVVRGAPLPDARVAGARLDFDPRDPEDLYEAIASWRYADNATLAQVLWGMLPFGLGAGPAKIDWAIAKPSADFDDEPVALKDGGFQKRHVVSAVLSLSDKPNVVMEALQTANRGFAAQRAGRLAIYSSQPQDPVMTITDAMLVGGFEFRNIKPRKDLVNIERCKFVAPDREYQDADGPVLRRDDLIAADGEEFEQSVRLAVTPTYQRAQRLMKGFLAEARLGKALTVNVGMRCYGLREGMVVRRFSESGRYSQQNGLYSVEDWQLAGDRSSLSLALAEYDPAIARDWNAQADELPFELEAAA